jgi:preprotein translocase subunit SecA
LVTVNDYLARRDTVWMGQIYNLLGLSVGCLNNEQSFLYDPEYKKPEEEKDKIRDELGSFKVVEDFLRSVSKKEAYAADITYGTNNEFGFDYLRDNMVFDITEKVQRGFNFAIVDEVDSILIDEARTPLIISSPAGEATEKYYQFAELVRPLKEEKDYVVDEKMRVATFTEEGQHKMVEKIGNDPWEEGDIITTHQLVSALQAKTLFLKDRDYVVKDEEIIIVDEFTGRLLPGRRFSGGLHQAIEAKENVKVKEESRTLATVTFQNYFRMYKKLSGMTGTAATSAEEFNKVYNVDTVVVPTNLPMIRKDFPDRIYKTEDAKFKALVKEIKARNKKGQPVLVGTTSIEKNEKLGRLLEVEGVSHNILNAKNHEKEGEVIAQAGRPGAITIATNMAGRGVDIVLGGNPPKKEDAEKVKELGGLHVIGTERHEARRIDNQLRGRSGRQGDPGSSQFFISLDDDIVRIFGGDRIKSLLNRFNIPEDMPIENRMISNSIESAQEKVEGYNFDIRKHLLDYDDVLNKQREKIYSERDKILKAEPEEQKDNIYEIVKKQIEKIVDFHMNKEDRKGLDFKEIYEEIKNIFPLPNDFIKKLEEIKNPEKIKDYVSGLAQKSLEAKKQELGEEFANVIKVIQLRTLDVLWMEHLENMEALRDSVRLRAYGQIDPLVAYRIDGSKMFQGIFDVFEQRVTETIFKVGLVREQQAQPISPIATRPLEEKQQIANNRQQMTENLEKVTSQKKPGRNKPCPCGSGKKYKKCCYPKYG